MHRSGAKLSMDGRSAWRDNVFVERLWRSVSYERVYLRAYDSVSDAQHGLAAYMRCHHKSRPHSGLQDRTPDQACWQDLPALAMAA